MKTKISFLALSLIVIITTISCNNTKKETKQETVTVKENTIETENTITSENTIASKKEAKLKSSLVCFVNNKFMGIDQIPVEVEGKTYYGCCQDCVAKINNIPVIENPPLTRSLYGVVEIEDEIPQKFYKSVAAVLRIVMEMKKKTIR